MTMDKEFNIGDRVMCTDNGALGVITSIDIDPIGVCDGYTVLFDDGEETWICADMVVHSDEPPYDPKTAFLSELKGLLEKYDAKISAYSVGYDGELDLTFDVGNCEVLYSEDNPIFKGHSVHTITADNIMDYDKE